MKGQVTILLILIKYLSHLVLKIMKILRSMNLVKAMMSRQITWINMFIKLTFNQN